MLAICSDLDETKDWPTYLEISRYLNTTEETKIGRGVGMEVGNTLYFDMPHDQFSYWNVEEHERAQVRSLIRSGHIDCFHSFGDEALDREQVKRSLADLEKHGCRLEVWVDHAVAPTNFGPDIMQGHGDQEHHSAFHSDCTIKHGVRFVWVGRVTSIIGQDVKYQPWTIWNRAYPLASLRTMIKDIVKLLLSYAGAARFRMHAANRLTRPVTLRSGHEVTEFIRCDPHPCGVSAGDNSRGISEVLSHKNLAALVCRGGVSIIYTHLGKALDPETLFVPETRLAFERLAKFEKDGDILVTTTRRLLGFNQSMRMAQANVRRGGSQAVVEIRLPPECSAQGLTFYWEGPTPKVSVNGDEIDDVQENPPDETGRTSLSVRWEPLQWVISNG